MNPDLPGDTQLPHLSERKAKIQWREERVWKMGMRKHFNVTPAQKGGGRVVEGAKEQEEDNNQ